MTQSRRRSWLFSALAILATRVQPQAPAGAHLFPSCPTPADRFVDAERRSLYIATRDGVRLAADVILPASRADVRLPTILTQTRYWRSTESAPISREQLRWVRRGYAVVSLDVRGTGASFGQWPAPWSRDEVRDMGDVIEWLVRQPWSNGRVGTIGTSYLGNTAQLAAVSNHPGLRAVIPKFMDFDVYSDLAYPGGVPNEFLIRGWMTLVRAMDLNEKSGRPPVGVRPVDGDSGLALLAAAVRDHRAESRDPLAPLGISARDEPMAGSGGSTEAWATYLHQRDIERSGVPIFGWAGWLDAGTANGAINRYLTWRNPQRIVIGPWGHGGGFHASPFQPDTLTTDPPPATHALEALCYFDHYLRDSARPFEEREIIYYTLGAERWSRTPTWPPAGIGAQRRYLGNAGLLTRERSTSSEGSDRYRVDFQATTGKQNRWYTQLGGDDVIYGDRRESDRRLLTYTSEPLTRDLEVTGNVIVQLEVASTAADGAFIAYLEDVDEQGVVRMITEGHLRALHRMVSNNAAPYRHLIPYHTYRKLDEVPLAVGQPARLTFGMIATSVLFKKGHRIRIALAGADHDTFARIPATGDVEWTVYRNAARSSYVDLPVRGPSP